MARYQDWYDPNVASYADYEKALEQWEQADYEYYSGGSQTPPGAPPPKPPGYDLWVSNGRPGTPEDWSGSDPYYEGAEYADFVADAKALMPWLPDELVQIYAEQWAETGDRELALAYMRQSDAYDKYFPGNRNPDGSLKMSEQEYFSTLDAYRQHFSDFGLNPDVFADKFVQLIEGDVSPQELMQRLGAAYEGIVTAMPEIRNAYAQYYGIELTDEAIFASFIDPDVGDAILNRRISVAQIGGQGLAHGFDVDLTFAERLEQGLDPAQASQFFGQAEMQLPTLGALVERHNDPDDDFDLSEYADALVFGDATQAKRMQRLFAAETSTFTDQLGTIATEQDLSVSGLKAQ